MFPSSIPSCSTILSSSVSSFSPMNALTPKRSSIILREPRSCGASDDIYPPYYLRDVTYTRITSTLYTPARPFFRLVNFQLDLDGIHFNCPCLPVRLSCH